MICIYHSRDLDGFTSGALVKHKYPDAELIGFDYGEKLSLDKIPYGQPIIMADVSMPMAEMEKLAEHSNWHLTWIDHHVTAIKEYNEYVAGKESFMEAICKDGVAACELVWNYLFPEENIPAAVTLLGKYDTWRNHDQVEWDEIVLPFQYGMRLLCNSPQTFPYEILSSYPVVLKIIDTGTTVLRYTSKQNELLCRKASFEFIFQGYKAICVNICGGSSQVFESVYNPALHDVMMPFYCNGKEWVYSLYTTHDDVDCSAIAKLYGGGGHRKAAGFQSKHILF